MSHLFPYANIVAGVQIFIIGFCFRWLGQLLSVLNWDLATRLGFQLKELPPEYMVYEHAIAVAEVTMSWLYGVAAVGLFLNAEWGYKLAYVPGSILLYNSISEWVSEGNRRAAGRRFLSDTQRIGWCTANCLAGLLALLVAWAGKTG